MVDDVGAEEGTLVEGAKVTGELVVGFFVGDMKGGVGEVGVREGASVVTRKCHKDSRM